MHRTKVGVFGDQIGLGVFASKLSCFGNGRDGGELLKK